MAVYRNPIADFLNIKDVAYLLRLNENKEYQWVEEGAHHQVRIAGKWLFPKEHIVQLNNESVQRERDLLIVGGIISGAFCFMNNDNGSCYEEGFR